MKKDGKNKRPIELIRGDKIPRIFNPGGIVNKNAVPFFLRNPPPFIDVGNMELIDTIIDKELDKLIGRVIVPFTHIDHVGQCSKSDVVGEARQTGL